MSELSKHYTQKLKQCERCKHHISTHRWDPERDARKGPFECSVPGCTCQKFLRHDSRYVEARTKASCPRGGRRACGRRLIRAQ